MKKVTKILLSIIIPICFTVSLSLGLVFGLKKNNDVSSPSQEQGAEPEEINIPGVYYASAEEVEESGVADAKPHEKGGAIYVGNGSVYNMTGGTLKSHSATFGGAVYVATGGTFTMTGGMIMLNEATLGGAIYVEAGGTLNLNGGAISGNAADVGAAIYMADGATVNVGENFTLMNNYTQIYDSYVAYYVDGKLKTIASIEATNGLFDVDNCAPLDYEHCNGYFTDSDLIHGIETGTTITLPTVQSAVSDKQFFNVYTKIATPDILTFTYSSGVYNVKQKSTSETTGVVVIPRQYNNGTNGLANVTEIYNGSYGSGAFYNNTNITAVYLPNSITKIGNYAFYKSSANATLKTVTIPDSVTTINQYAFYKCSGLTEITIPDSVTSIGDWAFSSCTGLTEITIPNSVTTINHCAFYNCSGLTEVTIPDSVTSIDYSAFSGCTGLTSVTIPNSVTSIGNSAFYGCTGLTEITIPNSVTSIGSFVDGCTNLQYNEYDNAKYLGNNTNSYVVLIKAKDTAIKTCEINENTKFIYNQALYYCTELTTITIPDKVINIGTDAFYGCTGLTQFIVDNNNTQYASQDGVLYNKTKTVIRAVPKAINNSITLPNTLQQISDSTFKDCSELTGLTFENNSKLTSIPAYAFQNCSALTGTLTIPASVTSIGNRAFQNCSKLTGLTFEDNAKLTSIAPYTFSGCGFTNITIPASVTSIGERAFNLCRNLTSLILPNSVNSLGDSAFRNCLELTEVTISSGLTSIQSNAFKDCSKLSTIIIDSSTIAGINSTSSYLASYATTVYVKDTITSVGTIITTTCPYQVDSDKTGYNKYVKTIPSNATQLIKYSGTAENVTIPNNITSISSGAFQGRTNLRTVTFEEGSTVALPPNVFKDCTYLRIVTIATTMSHLCHNSFENDENLEKAIWVDKLIITDYDFKEYSLIFNIYLLDNRIEETLDKLWLKIDYSEYFITMEKTMSEWLADTTSQAILTYLGGEFTVNVYKRSDTNPGSTSSGVDGWWHYVNDVPTEW